MIKVNNISMRFRMNGDNIQSLKELVIAFFERKIKYNDFWVFRNVSFEVKKGEVVGIIGRNGAGKSTMLKIISGILTPTEGSVTLNGKVVPMLELGSGFDFELTGRENIFLNGAILGYSEEFLNEKYDEIVEFSELGDFIETPIRNYSSGMMMRLAFSIATIVQPEILIVDEILAVGDEAFQRKSKRKMLELMGGGTTVLFVSHSIGQIREMCNRVIWLEQGKIKMQGETKLVCDEYQRYLDPTFGIEDKNQKASQAKKNLSDVLFIYGDDEREYEWRVTYTREQLVLNGIASNEISENDIMLDISKMYRVFIWVGCHNTENNKNIIQKIKKFNKKNFFDFSSISGRKESQRELVYNIDNEMCDGIIVSNLELEREFQTRGFKVFRNALTLCEDMYKYAEWAIYDRDVLPYCNTQYLTDDELINYNRAKQNLIQRQKIENCISIKCISKKKEYLTKEFLNLLKECEKLKIVITSDHEKENLGQDFESKILRKSFQKKQDIFRIYADLDFLILIFEEENSEDKLLEHIIYAAAVKVPCIILMDKDQIGAFTNGENILVCKDWIELQNTFKYCLKNKELCKKIGQNAYDAVYHSHSTMKTGDTFGQLIRCNFTKNICYVIKEREIVGTNWPILHQAALMERRGYDVALLTQGSVQKNIFFDNMELPVISRDMTYSFQNIDYAVAGDINSVRWVQDYTKIYKRFYFVQGEEIEAKMKGDERRLCDNQMYTPYSNLSYICSTTWLQNWLKKKYKQKSILLHNGIECDLLKTDREKFTGRKKILYIGNRKNETEHFDEAVQILNRLDKEEYEISIYLIEGEKTKDLEEYHVYTNMEQIEIYELFKENDILLSTKELIEYQQMALEMMATGGIVIFRKQKNISIEFKNSVNCSIYDPDIEDDALKKIEQICADKNYRETLIKNGKEMSLKFDWNNFDEDIVQIFQ